MRTNPVTMILLVLLVLSSLCTASFSYLYVAKSREMRGIEQRLVSINRNMAIVRGLAYASVGYSRTNSAINEILTKFSIKTPLTIDSIELEAEP